MAKKTIPFMNRAKSNLLIAMAIFNKTEACKKLE